MFWNRRPAAPGKPQSASDMLCPMFRKPLRDVCHRCEFYLPLPLKVIDMATQQQVGARDNWGCAIVHQLTQMRDVHITLNGVRKATEDFRNTAYTDQQKSMEAVIEMLRGFERTVRNSERTMSAVLTRGETAALIEGRTSLSNGADDNGKEH